MAGPICIGLLMVLAMLMDAATRIDWFGLNADLDDYVQLGSWILHRLTWTAFFLAIVCGYRLGNSAAAPHSDGSARRIVPRGLVLAFGLLLMGLLFFNTAALSTMVYSALDGVTNYQPMRWSGQDFQQWTAKPIFLERGFVYGGWLSMGLLLVAAAATTKLCGKWEAGARVRVAWAVVVIGCVLVAGWLVRWCAAEALPTLSPLLATTINEQPVVTLAMATVLAVFLAAAASLYAGGISASQTCSAGVRGQLSGSIMHERPGALLLGLAGFSLQAVSGQRSPHIIRQNWYWWSDMSMYMPDPDHLLWLAALIVLLAALRRAWRGEVDLTRQPLRSIEPGRFFAGWASFAATLLLVPAVGAWFGLSLMLYAGMP